MFGSGLHKYIPQEDEDESIDESVPLSDNIGLQYTFLSLLENSCFIFMSRVETILSLLQGLQTNPLPPRRSRDPKLPHAPVRVHNLRYCTQS